MEVYHFSGIVQGSFYTELNFIENISKRNKIKASGDATGCFVKVRHIRNVI